MRCINKLLILIRIPLLAITLLKRALLTLLLIVNVFCYAQTNSVKQIITPKVVVIKYKGQSDTLRMPNVSFLYPQLKYALEKQMFNGDTFDQTIKKYKRCGCGITGCDYYITFQNSNIISIVLSFETIGAYPDHCEKWLNFNIHTGNIYSLHNEITSNGLNWALDNYKISMKKQILQDKKDNTDESDEDVFTLNKSIDELTVESFIQKYVFTVNGIKFSTESVMPHAWKIFEPNRDWEVGYDVLKLFTQPNAIILKKH